MKRRLLPFKEFVTLQRGFDLPQAEMRNGDVPVLGSNCVIGFHDEAKVSPPGVVTGRSGTLGKVQFADQPYWPHNTALWVKDFRGNDPKYVYYKLQTLNLDRFSSGASVPTLNRNNLDDLPVEVPPVILQRQIAAVLSGYEDLIENNRRRMELLEEAARLLYREWFVRLRFPGHEHTHVANGITDGWERVRLDSVCSERDGIQTGPFGSQLHQSDYTDEGVPVVMPKDLVGFRIASENVARIPEPLAEKLFRHRMMEGDTVYGRRGDIGRRAFISSGRVGWLCGTGCLRIRPNPEAINARYLFETLGSPETAGAIANPAKGATMPNLNSTLLKSAPVLVAPRTLQDTYADHVEPMFRMIEALAEQNRTLKVARDLLLPRLMSGQIAV